MQEGLNPQGEGLRGLLGGSGDRVSMSTKRVRAPASCPCPYVEYLASSCFAGMMNPLRLATSP